MKVFVPFDEYFIKEYGLIFEKLVPFQTEYACLHLKQNKPDERDLVEEMLEREIVD